MDALESDIVVTGLARDQIDFIRDALVGYVLPDKTPVEIEVIQRSSDEESTTSEWTVSASYAGSSWVFIGLALDKLPPYVGIASAGGELVAYEGALGVRLTTRKFPALRGVVACRKRAGHWLVHAEFTEPVYDGEVAKRELMTSNKELCANVVGPFAGELGTKRISWRCVAANPLDGFRIEVPAYGSDGQTALGSTSIFVNSGQWISVERECYLQQMGDELP